MLGDRSITDSARQLLYVDRDSLAEIEGDRVVAIASLNGENVNVNGKTIAIDRGVWRRAILSAKDDSKRPVASLVPGGGERFLEPWVDDQLIHSVGFTPSAKGQAFLGVFTTDFTQEVMEPKQGAEVVYVYPNSPHGAGRGSRLGT